MRSRQALVNHAVRRCGAAVSSDRYDGSATAMPCYMACAWPVSGRERIDATTKRQDESAIPAMETRSRKPVVQPSNQPNHPPPDPLMYQTRSSKVTRTSTAVSDSSVGALLQKKEGSKRLMCHAIPVAPLSICTPGMFPASRLLVRGPRVRLHDKSCRSGSDVGIRLRYFQDYTCTNISSATLAQYSKLYRFFNTASGTPATPEYVKSDGCSRDRKESDLNPQTFTPCLPVPQSENSIREHFFSVH